MEYYGDFETWLHDVAEDKVFRIERIRKIWTPEEQENKYSDQTEYEETQNEAVLVEAIPLGGKLNNAKDYVLGFKDIWIHTQVVDGVYQSEVKHSNNIYYYRLSDIFLIDVTKSWKEELKENNIE